jgi:4-deoxy-L-threo-5-hexosulose-uronate ketol-isomerase
MEFLHTADKERYRRLTTSEMREAYLIDNLFVAGEVSLCYTDVERSIAGSAVPVDEALTLPVHKELASDFFTQRREIGVINIGQQGTIVVNGESFELDNRDSLYIGRGNEEVVFSSTSAAEPAQFYFVSYPAHKEYPSKLVKRADANRLEMGTVEECNDRVISQSIIPGIVDTCQVVMGFTELSPGSNWNTMPVHTHRRRTEVYMYFDLADDQCVFHFMGEPDETRSIVVRNGQAVASPSWSIHSGVGTRNYTFIWAMGGENQDFPDMDHVDMKDIL